MGFSPVDRPSREDPNLFEENGSAKVYLNPFGPVRFLFDVAVIAVGLARLFGDRVSEAALAIDWRLGVTTTEVFWKSWLIMISDMPWRPIG